MLQRKCWKFLLKYKKLQQIIDDLPQFYSLFSGRKLFSREDAGIDLRRFSGFQCHIEHGGFDRLVAVSGVGFRNREHSHPDTLFGCFNQQRREVDSGTGRTVIDDDREIEVVLIDPEEAAAKTEKESEAKPAGSVISIEQNTFETFVVGSSNRFAHAAAQAVAATPGAAYNHLHFYYQMH